MAAFIGIRTEFAHLIAYADNIDELRTKVQDLRYAVESLEDQIKEAENNQGVALVVVDAVVLRLLQRMYSLEEEATKIIVDEDRSSNSRCLMGLHPNLWACYKTSKFARKAIDEAAELLEMERKLDRVVYVDYSKCLGVRPIPDFEEFESRVVVSYKIMAALKDPKVNKVGVYGMAGIGKITLAEKIGAELQRNGTFTYVVLATICEKQNQRDNNYKADLLNIQKQIAGAFKIQLQGETLKDRAAELDNQLQKKNKVLIILDDIWSGFKLNDVGIPISRNFTGKFKILMTSRNRMVLENEMDSTNNFRLDSLPFDDAQNLFDKIIGGDYMYSNWPITAQQVIDQCGGIPILLHTIARELRYGYSSIWEDALTQLKQFDGQDIVEMTYKRIEVSYRFLKSEEIKKLFLLCAQFDHRSIAIEDLMKYAMGLNLFKMHKTIKEVSGRLHKYLRDLKGCCLLQDGDEEGIIKMNYVVHKFVTFVASRDHHVLSVENDDELEEWPSKDELEHFSAISLRYCHLPVDQMLPVAVDNPKLKSFVMLRSKIDESFYIPENFFVGMKGLTLIGLTKMSLSSVLVSSLSALVKLRTLYLDHCELSDISVIGELPMLQVLSLVGSSIVLVPKEMGKLGGTLKLLDLRDCCELEMIASGVISKLTLLEDLRIGASFMRWERLEGRDKSSDTTVETCEAEVASLEEFKNLRNLIHIEICIPDHAKMFPKDLVFNKLETFKIYIGNRCWSRNDYIETRTLQISESSTVVEIDCEGTKALIGRSERLWLAGVMSSISVSEMDPKGFPELRHLCLNIIGCPLLTRAYESSLFNKKSVFPRLEVLRVSTTKAEKIWDDESVISARGTCWQNLTTLSVNGCNNLSYLFTSSMVKSLAQLKQLEVGDCGSIKEIVKSTERDIQLSFPKLDILKLECLPNLQRFSQANVFECLLLRKLVIRSCPKLKTLVAFPNIEELEINDSGSLKKIWDDEIAISPEGTCWLQNLTILSVNGCNNLSYLFTSSMVKSLAQLKQLEVGDCESIKEIVESTERDIQLSFPKLDILKLECLPNLQRFSQANVFECLLLRKLVIRSCPKLKTLVAFCNIEELEIIDSGSFKTIWGNQLRHNSLSRLKMLTTEECQEDVFTPNLIDG